MISIEAPMAKIKDDMPKKVAQAIRGRREELGLSLRSLAERSGISSSMISDVERGTKSPTIATLAALAQALDVPVSVLLDDSAQRRARIHVVRAFERCEAVDPKSGAKRDSYRPALTSSKVELLRYAVPPRTLAGPFAPHPSGTIEHMYLAGGRVRVTFEPDIADLETGDCCTCVADAPHAFDNRENGVEALIYIVVERP
jgi:transcriptional regulator with XRE-family HTH domain